MRHLVSTRKVNTWKLWHHLMRAEKWTNLSEKKRRKNNRRGWETDGSVEEAPQVVWQNPSGDAFQVRAVFAMSKGMKYSIKVVTEECSQSTAMWCWEWLWQSTYL